MNYQNRRNEEAKGANSISDPALLCEFGLNDDGPPIILRLLNVVPVDLESLIKELDEEI